MSAGRIGPTLVIAIDAVTRMAQLSCGHQFRIGDKVSLPAVGDEAVCPICDRSAR